MGRGDTTFLRKTRSVYHPTELSDWYSARIEPYHEHLWEPDANIAFYNVFGRCVGGGIGAPRKIPIVLFTPSQHRGFLEHVNDINAVKALFASIISRRNYEDEPWEDGKGLVLVQAIVEWEKAGYPGTWDKWWARYWERWKERWSVDAPASGTRWMEQNERVQASSGDGTGDSYGASGKIADNLASG